jgi:voltage-gated potassium channel
MAIVAAVLKFLRGSTKTSTRVVLIAGGFFVVLGTVGSYLTEGSIGEPFNNFWNCFWWTLVTMSTVGYGDMFPVTTSGRIIALICMIGGPVVMVSIVGTVALTLYDKWTKGVKGMANISSKEHIIICGWNTSAKEIIDELRLSEKYSKSPITIIDDKAESKPSDDVFTTFVRGNASELSVLKQANIDEAAYAIVLAEDSTPAADQKTVLTVLAIESTNPEIITCAQLNDQNNEEHLHRAGCDIIVNTSALTSKLLAMSLQNPTVNNITKELVSGGQGNEIYRVEVPKNYVGRSFSDSLQELKKSHDVITIGIERDGQCLLNPPNDTSLKETDWLFVISEEAPNL